MFKFFVRKKPALGLDPKNAIIVGSSPLAPQLAKCDLDCFYKIAVNHAWHVRDDFDYLVYPDDFPDHDKPQKNDHFSGREISNHDYMKAIDKAGGIIFAGATMAFATGYWAVSNFNSRLIGYYASDMVYDQNDGQTHFYGKGAADPLRKDVSLTSLEARSTRLFAWAIQHNKLLVNFSNAEHSRLVFPHVPLQQYQKIIPPKQLKLGKIWLEFQKISKDIERIEKNAPFNALDWNYVPLIATDEHRRFIEELDMRWNEALPYLKIGYERYCEQILN